jgi:hypothetical protein
LNTGVLNDTEIEAIIDDDYDAGSEDSEFDVVKPNNIGVKHKKPPLPCGRSRSAGKAPSTTP